MITVFKPQREMISTLELYFPQTSSQDLEILKALLLKKFEDYQKIALTKEPLLDSFFD